MAFRAKQNQQFARQLFQLSMEGGVVSPERVAGVLAYVEKHRPAHPAALLKAYRRLIAAELARGQAEIEHAGSVSDEMIQNIAAAMSKKYGRVIAASAKPGASLIAGLRVRVGDDVYEASVAGRLAALVA
jgi:F-type H+-transporting ATPase subunit delta